MWIVIAVVLVVTVNILHYLSPKSEDLDYLISFIGTAFTILCFAITIDQIRQTRRKIDETNKALKEIKSQILSMTQTKEFIEKDSVLE